ncbi:MAG: N-acetyltransferase [Spirochaetia bacterium]|nr:N-acetyltransferase [Spirochaetia bacterium]
MDEWYVHPSSYVDDNVTIGKRTKIWHFCHIQSGATIGEGCSLGQNVNVSNNVVIGNGCKIQNNVSLYEGVTLEDNVFCGPSCVFTNDLTPRAKYPKGRTGYLKTLVREGASIGANATIVCGITIGRWALIGSGAVVTKDVPDYALVVGVPARFKGWVCECGGSQGADSWFGHSVDCKSRATRGKHRSGCHRECVAPNGSG